MRRRQQAKAPTVADMPPQLRDLHAPDWGWSGPHYVDGQLVTGYYDAWDRWRTARNEWCDGHPAFDWMDDILLRHPDEPWTPLGQIDVAEVAS